MKIFILQISFFLGVVFATSAQTNLTFRLTDPRIIRSGDYDYLEFEIQVKAGEPGTYLWSGQAILHFNDTSLTSVATQWSLTRGSLLAGTNTAGNAKYNLLKTITGTPPLNVLNVGWNGDVQVAVNGPNQQDFNEVPVEFVTLLLVKGRIINESGTAGVYFRQEAMNGQQFRCASGTPFWAPYQSPCQYHEKELRDLSLGRIFSSVKGWSQIGNPSGEQWVNWSAAVNTSVWDTLNGPALVDTPDALALNLKIHPGARLKLLPGSGLTCTGLTGIGESAGLTIASDSSGSASFIDNGSIYYSNGGTVRLEKHLKAGRWDGFSLPVDSLSTHALSSAVIKYLDEPSQTFRYIPAPPSPDSTLTGVPFRGYLTKPVDGTDHEMIVTGHLITGNVSSVPVTWSHQDSTHPLHGFALLGNPYASAADLASGNVFPAGCDHKAWVLNPGGSGNYDVFIANGAGTHSGKIPSMQSFYVRHAETSALPLQISLGNNNRTHQTESDPDTSLYANLLYLKTSDPYMSRSDQIAVHFRADATPAYDSLFDADKIWGEEDAPWLFSLSGNRPLAVQALPYTGIFNVVPLGFRATVQGNYRFLASGLTSFEPGNAVFLEDRKLNIFQSLGSVPEYNFEHELSDDPMRFRLHFTSNATPSVQASDITFSSPGEEQFTFNWTDGNGTGRVVFISLDTTSLPQPVPDADYLPDTVFGQGSQIGNTGWFCVFNGDEHVDGITITNLTSGTPYRLMVCEFREHEGLFIYNHQAAANNPATMVTCPVQTASVTGSDLACMNSSSIIYTTESGKYQYHWSVSGGVPVSGSGTSSVGIIWSRAGFDTVSVFWQDERGCLSRTALKTVSVTAPPDTAGSIAGPANVCIGSTMIDYYINPVLNAELYSWAFSSGITLISGEGTDSITVLFPDSTAEYWLSVRAVNHCFQGEPSPLKHVLVYCPDTGQIIHANMAIPAYDSLLSSGTSIRTGGQGQYFTVDSLGYVNLAASQKIRLLPDTRVYSGGVLLAQIITGCLPCDNAKMTSAVVTEQTENGFDENQVKDESSIKIYPNPFTGGFTVDTRSAPTNHPGIISVYNGMGVKVHAVSFVNEISVYIPMTNVTSGFYMVIVYLEDQVFTAKLLKK